MLKYLFLGIIQGLTEFLPVSSTAHLVILQKLFGMAGQEIVVSIVLHLGTVFALVIFFFKDIINLFKDIKLLFFIFAATVITGIIGISGKSFFEELFSTPKFIAIALIFTGTILILTRNISEIKRKVLNLRDALILGAVQGIAIIPGISRSGMTISSLLFRKVDRELSFRFSCLASIPAVLGAVIVESRDINFALQVDLKSFAVGFIFSFLAGFFSLWLLKIALYRARFHYFGYYCIFIAVITLLFVK